MAHYDGTGQDFFVDKAFQYRLVTVKGCIAFRSAFGKFTGKNCTAAVQEKSGCTPFGLQRVQKVAKGSQKGT